MELAQAKHLEFYTASTKIEILAELLKAANLNIDINDAHLNHNLIIQTITEKLKIMALLHESEVLKQS